MGIRQLAKELQLSIGTVSRALNDRPDVNALTRARVKEAAHRLGYVPNHSGRSLRSGRTAIVAAVISSRGIAPSPDSGLLKVLEGTRRTLRQHGLDLIVLFHGPDEDALENLRRIVQRRIADAIIISRTTAADPRLAYLRDAGIDHVAFGRSAGVTDYPYVDLDIERAAAEALRLFVAEGHRRVAVAVGEQRANYEDLLAGAFCVAAASAGLDAAAVHVLPTHDGRLTGAGRAALQDCRTGPTAILAAHESIAAGLYADLAEAGRRVGTDVAVICTFPSMTTRGLAPALSHFDADLDAVGVALARGLAVLPGHAAGDVPVLVPLSFVPRSSHRRAAAQATA